MSVFFRAQVWTDIDDGMTAQKVFRDSSFACISGVALAPVSEAHVPVSSACIALDVLHDMVVRSHDL